jgi:Ca2+-binding RTX toxin-like protein
MGNKGESLMKGGFFVRDRYQFSRKTLQMKPTLHSKPKTLNQVATVVFVDAGVENYQQLVDGVIPTAEVFVLDTAADGIEQISQVLQQRQDVDAVHIISHGAPGCLYLGNTQLSLDTFNYYATQLQKWDVANLLLYGCNVAAGDAGAEFIAKLQALTGAEIAASKTLTGSAAKGGNWQLEVTTAQMQSTLALQPEAMANYRYVLDNQYGYAAIETTYQPIDLVPGASGVTSILDSVDDAFTAVNLGSNTFNFFGTNYFSLFISSNGLITFGSGTTQYNNTNLSSSPNQAAIAPLWDDWVTIRNANDQVLYQFQDVDSNGTNDQLVIEWNDAYHISSSVTGNSSQTFQTILQLNTGSTAGNITFNYVDLDSGDSYSNGSSATVGIRDASGDPLLVSYNNGSNPLLGNGKAIKISAIPPNAAPTDITLSNNSIDENVIADSTVGTFNSTDPDTGNTFTYSLVSGTGSTDNSAFTIVDNQLRINASPDFETKNNYSVRVRTTDQGGLSHEEVFTVNVNDIDEFIYGTPGADILRGTASADQINGLGGNDRLYGEAGNDTINGDDGDDLVYGGDGNDYLLGGNGSDRLYGDAGNDRLFGDAGNDILYGGAGDDLLYGGAGSDRLYGDAGRDTFVLQAGMGTDTIYDFEDGVDLLRLDGGLTFGQLNIVQRGSSTQISDSITGDVLVSLYNTNSTLITQADFTPVAIL